MRFTITQQLSGAYRNLNYAKEGTLVQSNREVIKMKKYRLINKHMDIANNHQQSTLFERVEAVFFDILISVGFIIALSLIAVNLESLT